MQRSLLLSIGPGDLFTEEHLIVDTLITEFRVRDFTPLPNPFFSERYDSLSGEAKGVAFLGMTCTVITMMIDGLCKKHELRWAPSD